MILSEEAFLQIAPFHIVWDTQGRMVRISPALRHLWHLSDSETPQLQLKRPFSSPLDVSWFPEITDMVISIMCAKAPQIEVRGELILLPQNQWLLCAQPPMGRVSDLEKAGLKLSDLPLHAGLGDALIAAEAAHISLEEARISLASQEKANSSLVAMNQAFERFLPRAFLEALGMLSPEDTELGARASVDTTVMFADLRNFTTISEQMGAEEIFSFLNRYLAKVAPCIRNNEGFVVHYIGDGILALFNGSAELAVNAAIQMQMNLKQAIDKKILSSSLPTATEITLGVALHFGRVEMGIIGESGRWDSTIISDTVNSTCRMEDLTKVFGAEILVTAEVSNQISNINTRRLGSVKVKGRSRRFEVHEVLDSLDTEILHPRLNNKAIFESAVADFESQDFCAASKGFERCLSKDPTDQASRHYHALCIDLELDNPLYPFLMPTPGAVDGEGKK